MYTSAIPLLNGEKISGVTLHRIDAGIDTGEIIAQKKIKITKKDNAKTLYLKYIKYGIELVKEQIDNLMEDKIKSKKQSSFHSTYYSRNFLDYSNLKINLTQTAWQINQTIRAFCFRDYQLPEIYSYKIIHCKILKTRSNCKPGNILEDKEDRLILSTIDYNICLIKDQLELIFELCKKDTIRELKKVQDIHLYINEKNLFGKSLLMECAYYNSKKTFKYLISKGADLNSIDYNGKSVLMYVASGAILTKDTEILKYILDNKGDIHHKDFSGKDIFHNIENHSSEAYHLIKKYYD
ncbi:MAG: ankyrin repeat domain-containing protein [Candidatus Azobacteroides sp.]|nr:ankyrin repeat domain-containing protein [Candidatus Azobacteroides sp.]